MGIYRRSEVDPEWEPIPWDADVDFADKQELGFHRWATTQLSWTKVDPHDFPTKGLFGYDRQWFSENDISFIATYGETQLVLIDRVWFGFPDPPRWGLASRVGRKSQERWVMWGSFSEIPKNWQIPQQTNR